jgi:hypothetical protein
MSSAKLVKISKTIEMVEIFMLKFVRSPQLTPIYIRARVVG